MDKYRPCSSIIAMFTSDSQHPPRSRHAVYLGVYYLSIIYIRCFIAGLKVGFTVYNPVTSSSNPLRFYNVVSNTLNGYNATSGKFTCQIPGLYLFTWMVMRKSGNTGYSYCYIYVNGGYSGIRAEAYGTSAAEPSSTNTLVRHLNKGDTVYLRCINGAYMLSDSSFSGVLIQPDDA